eukprot:2319662-Prymnesium_polylepis.1
MSSRAAPCCNSRCRSAAAAAARARAKTNLRKNALRKNALRKKAQTLRANAQAGPNAQTSRTRATPARTPPPTCANVRERARALHRERALGHRSLERAP